MSESADDLAERAQEVTRLLKTVAGGDERSADRLMELVYSELRGLAGACLGPAAAEHTLQPTALVHEAWLTREPE